VWCTIEAGLFVTSLTAYTKNVYKTQAKMQKGWTIFFFKKRFRKVKNIMKIKPRYWNTWERIIVIQHLHAMQRMEMKKQIICSQPTKYSENQNTLVNDARKARNASSRYHGTHWKKCATYCLKYSFAEFVEWGGKISKEAYYMNSSQPPLLTMKPVCQTGSVKVQLLLTDWKNLS